MHGKQKLEKSRALESGRRRRGEELITRPMTGFSVEKAVRRSFTLLRRPTPSVVHLSGHFKVPVDPQRFTYVLPPFTLHTRWPFSPWLEET
jgi:hypothetical protein